MQNLSLSVDLVNGVLSYLGTRPFVEVASLINAIHEEAKGQLPDPVVEELSENG